MRDRTAVIIVIYGWDCTALYGAGLWSSPNYAVVEAIYDI